MSDGCDEMSLLVQADIDGELTPAEAARVAAHLDRCPDCAAVQIELLALSSHLQAVTRHLAPAALHARLASLQPPQRRVRPAGRIVPVAGWAAAAALAACVALLVLPQPRGTPAIEIVSSHLRALQPGHLMDVASSDQHTVKPWFDGRLAFAPPVKDLAADGFPLLGARLDALESRPVAALVYGRRQHVIDLYAAPGGQAGPGEGTINGYNYRRWAEDGMDLWAVSDLNATELAEFARLWRRPAPATPPAPS